MAHDTPTSPRRSRHGGSTRKRATLAEVAQLAGVSPITASRMLREPEKVSPALRKRIQKAVDDLGYVPNHVAAGLASGTSRVVPVIIPTLEHPVYVPFLHGVQCVLGQHGYEMLLGTTEYSDETEARLVSTVLGWFPAGLLVAGIDHLPATRKRLGEAVRGGTPVLEIMELAPRPIDMNVGISNDAVGRAVAHYFADRGYRHIAYAGTMASLDRRGLRRVQGFKAALAERGLATHYDLRVEENFSLATGARLLDGLLERFPGIQAIFFANDDIAAGGVLQAQRRGIRVPEDLAIMGFNDIELAGALNPPLSSVAVDRLEMGRIAARMLLARLAGEDPPQRKVDVGFRIVERATTAANPTNPSNPTKRA